MRGLYQDLRFGMRLLLSNPPFTAVAVFTLALGIAANITVFSWIDGILLRPYPGATRGQELAILDTRIPGSQSGGGMASYIDYLDYRRDLKSLSGLAAHHEDVFSLGDATNPQAVWGELVSGNYFDVLGVTPALGRFFTPAENDDQPGAYPVAVISDRLWRTRLRGDPRAIGKTLRINRLQITVVGIAPPRFRGTMPGLVFDLWMPATMGKDLGLVPAAAFEARDYRWLYQLARLKPGVALQQASAEASTYARALEAANPKTNRSVTAVIVPSWEFRNAAPDLLLKPLRALMAISVLVLMIVCANVANLLLARSIARRRELSIRLALGAGGGRLARQMFVETLLLVGAGTLAGLLLTPWMADVLPAMVPRIGVSVALGFELNARVVGFTLLACLTAALVSAGAPVLHCLNCDVHEALKEGGRSGRQGRYSNQARGLLVVSEVALATVALVGAGLFVRSFYNASNIYPGFDKSNVILARFYPAGTGPSTPEMQQFCLRLRDALRIAPGITDATYADFAPLGGSGGPWDTVAVEGYTPAASDPMRINRYLVAPGYFQLLRVPILAGRDFTAQDNPDALPVLIVNQAFAQRYFHGGNPVGRKIQYRGKTATVVGVAQDHKYFDVAEAPRPHFFAPFLQRGNANQQVYFFLRTAGDPIRMMASVRRMVALVDPNVAAFDVMPLSEWTDITLLPQRAAATLMAGLGLISLILAGIGLYGVMAYTVSQRTQEIGIRMALGARPQRVLRGVIWQGMVYTIPGLAAGILGAVVATRVVSNMLVRVSANDPATFAAASLFLIAVALLASYLPARRATRVDPMVALRRE